MGALLTRREAWIWAACVIVVSVLLVLSHFESADPDSALYADLSRRLSAGPPSHWIAPEWWGNWDSEGLFRENPAGIFVLPALFGAMGLPAVQAAYIVGITAGLACLLVTAYLIAGLTSRDDGRLALVLLQLTPLAFIFRIRTNHEYPMLLCLLITLVGIDAARRSWRFVWIVPLSLTAAVLIKGVFVAIIVVAAGLWLLVNPMRVRGSAWRPLAASAAGVMFMAAAIAGYDALYHRVTGETFWSGYWARQLAPLTIDGPGGQSASFGEHLRFYLLRMLWHPAPWSFALAAWAWRSRGRLGESWRQIPDRARRGVTCALGFAGLVILALSPISRFAERYAFSANAVVAAAGAVTALHIFPRLRETVVRLDRAVPALPALVWLALMLLRLTVGPLLPRISG